MRHGESTWVAEGRFQGTSDPPLSRLGERQAALTAERLAAASPGRALPLPPGRPVACWHSPLLRAAGTAGAIAGAWSPPLSMIADARLREMGLGAWEGRTAADVRAAEPELLDGWRHDPLRHTPSGGESLEEVARRVASFAAELVPRLAEAEDGGPTPGLEADRVGVARGPGAADPVGVPVEPVAGTASRSWTIVVAHGGALRALLLALLGIPLDAFWAFPFALCGMSVIELRGGRATLRTHNVVEHVAGLDVAEVVAAVPPKRDAVL